MPVTTPILSKLAQQAVLATAVLLLAGCGALPNRDGVHSRNDGPPSHNINITAIPDAVPRIEANSRYGNPASYVVNGKRYHVMASNKAFQQRGLASWYGTKFHGRKTSSGEPYDMFAMTAAHKTLPLPTWLEVINHDNQKRVVVKVNDRGPFVSGRIIDLSYAAATKLGVVATGTANVTIRSIDPVQYLAEQTTPRPVNTAAITTPVTLTPDNTAIMATTRPAEQPSIMTLATPSINISPPVAAPVTASVSAPSTGINPLTISGFYLQVAAFSERSNAELLRQRLLPLQPGDIQINSEQQSGPTLYRVRIGPLGSLSEAGKISARISSLGLGEPKIMLD